MVPIENSGPGDEVAVPGRGPSASGVSRGSVAAQQSDQSDPLAEHSLRLLGTFDGESQILVTGENMTKTILTPKKLSKLGYAYFPISACVGRLEFNGRSRVVLCGSEKEKTRKSDNRAPDNA